MMEAMNAGSGGPEEALVRHYLTALNNGRFLDALNAFSMDARLRDELGHERHGIREIAASFAHRGEPIKVEIEEVRQEGDAVTARVRMTSSANRAPKVYRSVFRVDRDRIRSLVIEPVPPARARRTRITTTA
ncbi:MAG TPA: nuclear transport factor 2 family protein [Thermoplasmata archaeon]|nr:nuclear transport factor 2 family protein [Thermoplasmata archaeon]